MSKVPIPLKIYNRKEKQQGADGNKKTESEGKSERKIDLIKKSNNHRT
jgi:hypothetical protein